MNKQQQLQVEYIADTVLGIEPADLWAYRDNAGIGQALAMAYERGAADTLQGLYKPSRKESDMLAVPNTNLRVQAIYNHDKTQVGVKTYEGDVTLCLYAWDVEQLKDYDALATKCEHESVGTFRVICQAIEQLTREQ